MGQRVDELVGRLQKGGQKTAEIMGRLSNEQWQKVLYAGPPVWTVRDLLAHFLSAEQGLPQIAQDIAAGGPGAPAGFDYDRFNASEQARLAGVPVQQLLTDLVAARQATVAWVMGLEDADLDRVGRHPALGEINLETFITAVYGHQLLHMRELQTAL